MPGASGRAWMACLILAGGIAFFAVLMTPDPPIAPMTRRAEVQRVYDGDTFDVVGFGRVRVLGVDALDGHNQDRTMQQAAALGIGPERVRHWAREAEEFAREKLTGRKVEVEPAGEMVDEYGRTLAYIGLGMEGGAEEVDFGTLLLQSGLATAYRVSSHPRLSEYITTELTARAEGVGLWSELNGAPPNKAETP